METIKISNEKKEELVNKLAEIDFSKFSDIVKKAESDKSGSFEVVITTENVDRHGEVIKLDAWNTEHYMKNPVVLWGHSYSILPIGVCTSIEIKDGKMIAKGKFAPEEANPMAQQIRRLYDLGIIRTTSVGFIAKQYEGNMITEAELLEFSFVSVPANPYALSTLVENNISVNEMISKGILEAKAETTEPIETKCDDCDDEEEDEATEEAVDEEDTEEVEENKSEDGNDEDTESPEEATDTTETDKSVEARKIAILSDIKASISALEDLYNHKDVEGQGEDALDDEEKKALELSEKRRILQKASGVLAEVLGEARKAKL